MTMLTQVVEGVERVDVEAVEVGVEMRKSDLLVERVDAPNLY